jgi:recombination protein RecR
MNQTSKILEEAVHAFSSLPGIGKKTAMRLALHLASQDRSKVIELGQSIIDMGEKLISCKSCFAYSDTDLCSICADEKRDHSVICVVESIRDLFAIEELQSYRGIYHVLGGLISPIDGVGPDKLNISSLFEKLTTQKFNELILAIRPTIEGDTTAYYIGKHISNPDIRISMLARGVAFGSELEYADELTLSRSLLNRTPYTIHDNQLA